MSPGQKEVNERQLQFSGDAQIANCFYSPKSSSLSALSALSTPVFSSLTPPCYPPPTQAFPLFFISPTAPPTGAPVASIYIWQREKRRTKRRRSFRWFPVNGPSQVSLLKPPQTRLMLAHLLLQEVDQTVLSAHVQKIHTHKNPTYARFHAHIRLYKTFFDHGNVRCFTLSL